MVRGLVILCAVVMLGGCSGESLRLNSEYSDSYSIHYFAYLTSGRDTRVVVRGNPFKMDSAGFARSVTAAMQGNHWGARTHFTTTPGPSAHQDFKVVLLFNGPENVTAHELCARPERFDSVAGASKLRVLAAWCYDGVAETEVEAWTMSSVTDPRSSRFREFMAQVTMTLFPLQVIDEDAPDGAIYRY